MYILLALSCAGVAYAMLRVTRQFERAPISLDEDGIWPTKDGKADGLVRWEEIISVKERQYGQRLELLGADGNSLIKLEYQLVGFEKLRQIVLSKIHQPNLDIKSPATLGKSIGYHVFTMAAIFGFTTLAYYVGQKRPVLGLLVFAVVVLLITYDYLKTVAELTISQRTLDVRYPLRRKTLDLSEVSSIYLSDQFVKGNRLPEVNVASSAYEKPIRLRQLGVDASELYGLLIRWKNERLFVQDTSNNRFTSATDRHRV
jgi:hypothetical protein